MTEIKRKILTEGNEKRGGLNKPPQKPKPIIKPYGQKPNGQKPPSSENRS